MSFKVLTRVMLLFIQYWYNYIRIYIMSVAIKEVF